MRSRIFLCIPFIYKTSTKFNTANGEKMGRKWGSLMGNLISVVQYVWCWPLSAGYIEDQLCWSLFRNKHRTSNSCVIYTTNTLFVYIYNPRQREASSAKSASGSFIPLFTTVYHTYTQVRIPTIKPPLTDDVLSTVMWIIVFYTEFLNPGNLL